MQAAAVQAAAMQAPSRVFIVPYRDRLTDKERFLSEMKNLLSEPNAEPTAEPTYEIYFAHQYDYRPFNRGAMKNIGFLAVRDKYPEAYKNITFIFHDVDTWPSAKGLVDYQTTAGVVKHFYGYRFALGGMFAIKGGDFEKTKGFPNFWGWGIEDNAMNDRCLAAGLVIDRSQFYDITDKRIARSFDGFQRIISRKDSLIYKQAGGDDFTSLTNIQWTFHKEYINVRTFDCAMSPTDQVYAPVDIRKTKKLIVPKVTEFRRSWKMLF